MKQRGNICTGFAGNKQAPVGAFVLVSFDIDVFFVKFLL